MRKVTVKHLEKLQRMADRAADARDKFETAFRKAQDAPGWEEACDAAGRYAKGNPGDWMC